MKTMQLETAEIISNVCLIPGVFGMTLSAPSIAEKARPGQFVMVYLDKGELLLPRPISFCDVNLSRGTLSLVYQVVGSGTKALSKMAPWQSLKLLGPLGNGFLVKGRNNVRFSRVALVGGGIGVPPLHLLAKVLATRGTYVDAYLGFRNFPIMIDEFRYLSDRLFITTEDGSFGHKGNITEVLESQHRSYDEILVCGPKPMLTAVADYAKKQDIACQVCLEERMACGLGACVGCVVKVGKEYVRVCSEGPVFYVGEVDFNEQKP